MELKDNRAEDHNAERAFGTFLDESFYPDFTSWMGYSAFRRENSRREQLGGCDVMLFDDEPGGQTPLRLDEKASITYCNGRRLDTFLMELSCMRSDGTTVDGWFLNPDAATDKYVLATDVRADFADYADITADSFLTATLMVLDRRKVADYLASRGLDKDALRLVAKQLRNGERGTAWQNPRNGSLEWDFSFDLNRRLSTQPVCVKLSNPLLYRLCDARYLVRNIRAKKVSRSSRSTRPPCVKLSKIPPNPEDVMHALSRYASKINERLCVLDIQAEMK